MLKTHLHFVIHSCYCCEFALWCSLLPEGETAIIDICFSKALPIEKYADYKQLGRFTLRKEGKTIGAGIVLDVLPN